MSHSIVSALEARRLLSSAIVDGVLQVTTGDANDQITINLESSGGARKVAVVENGSTKRFEAAQLISIVVRSGGGDDQVALNANGVPWTIPATLFGGAGNDTLRLNNNYGSRVYGDEGDDSIYGSGGRDYIKGGAGNDYIRGRLGSDKLYGEDGHDRIFGEGGNDTIDGGAGPDDMHGGNGDDSLNGPDPGDIVSGDAGLNDGRAFTAPGNATKMVYSSKYGLLFMMNSGSAIHVVDTVTGKRISLQMANERFTDIDLSPSGNYLFAADFGGESTGYGTAINPSQIHRFNLQTRQWEGPKVAPEIAYRIEAVDDTRFLTLTSDQWVDMYLQQWGTTITKLDESAADYYGDIEYDAATGRIFHGNGGSSSSEIHAFRLVGNDIRVAEASGTYGSAQSGGGTSVLSQDGSRFYFGKLQVEGLDVTHNMHTFSELIYSASSQIALGDRHYFSADTGKSMGTLPFTTTVYSWNDAGDGFFAYNAADNTLHYFKF